MTDYEALYAAVRADPADDFLRLQVADWLDEHAGTQPCPRCSGEGCSSHGLAANGPCRAVSDGRAERAELIRTQCKLAATVADQKHRCAGAITADMETRPLRDRERALLEVYGEVWALGEVVRPASIEVGGSRRWLTYGGVNDMTVELSRPIHHHRPWQWSWLRGWPAHFTCSGPDWVRHGDRLCAALPVERVTLTSLPILQTFGRDPRTESPLMNGGPMALAASIVSLAGRRKYLPYLDYDSTTYRSARLASEQMTLSLLQTEWPGVLFDMPTDREPVPVPEDTNDYRRARR